MRTDPDERTAPGRYDNEGLTKREHFAAMALQGIMANADPQICGLGTDRVAEWAVGASDALIAALNKAQA